MYWLNYRYLFAWNWDEDYTGAKHAPTNLRSDMIAYLRIFNDKKIEPRDNMTIYNATDYPIFGGTWRVKIIDACHILPLLFLLIELAVNKIKFPKR